MYVREGKYRKMHLMFWSIKVWKKEVGSLEFKDALVIGERGGTMVQSWYEKSRVAEQRNKLGRQILGY